jgi:hypothetical protein
MFTEALFTIAKKSRNNFCPDKQMWWVHTVEYYLAMKRYKCCHMQVIAWMDLENILSKRT